MSKIVVSLILLSLFMFMGCSQKSSGEYVWQTIKKEQSFPKSNIDKLKYPILLVGDNQYNNIYTDPAILRNFYADKLTKVAIRPPQLDIFSKELFDLTLQEHKSREKFVIHLGDALNIACLNEWNRFENSLLSSVDKNKFVMAPGNHDFYWYGVSSGQGSKPKERWATACDNTYPIPNDEGNESKRFTKGKFINRYLAYIPLYYPPNTTGEYTAKSKDAFIQRIFVQRFPTELDEYKSFLVQQITIPSQYRAKSLKGIVIDTANYEKRPLNVLGYFQINGYRNPGNISGITKAQQLIIEKWSEEYREKREKFMIFGHHPLKEFESKEKQWITNLIDKNPYAIGYISAHTHLGYVFSKEVIEVNVGSITDYPNEIRNLHADGSKLSSTLYPIRVEELKESKWCSSRYDYTYAPYDSYTSYKQVQRGLYTAHYTHEATLDISITTYLRLFNDINARQYFGEDENKTEQYDKLIAQATKQRVQDCFASIGSSQTPNILLYDQDNNINFAKSVRCRSDKLEILKKLQELNDNLKISSPAYTKDLRSYGSCQSLRASEAEWIGNLERKFQSQ